jgi:putative ABC transport system ATP-binding protein
MASTFLSAAATFGPLLAYDSRANESPNTAKGNFMAISLLSCQNLSKTYESDGRAVDVIRNVSLEIFPGDFTVLMGSSGSGKSSLLYLLSGLESISSGSISFDGQDITRWSEEQLSLLRRRGMGFVFQAFNLVPNLTLLENILAAGYLTDAGKTDIEQRAKKLLSDMGISDLANRLPAQISGGEQQRAAIARALVNAPKILFADEPTGALNSASGTRVLDQFSALAMDNQTIFMVTHDLKAACRGKRILFLRDGELKGEFRFEAGMDSLEQREESLFSWLSAQGW